MCIRDRYSHVKDLFFLMQKLAMILQAKKARRGAIDFDVKEAKVLVDSKGNTTDVVLRERGASDRIIEEFMLLANETVAEHFKWLELPFIYRVHENPKPKKLLQFSGIAKTLGYTIKGSLENVYPGEMCIRDSINRYAWGIARNSSRSPTKNEGITRTRLFVIFSKWSSLCFYS